MRRPTENARARGGAAVWGRGGVEARGLIPELARRTIGAPGSSNLISLILARQKTGSGPIHAEEDLPMAAQTVPAPARHLPP